MTVAPRWSSVPGGLANVLIVRRERASRVTACGFLVDVYCLGVKNTVGPVPMGSGTVEEFRRMFFETAHTQGVEVAGAALDQLSDELEELVDE